MIPHEYPVHGYSRRAKKLVLRPAHSAAGRRPARCVTTGDRLSFAPEPANKLNLREREEVVALFHMPEYENFPPSKMVPQLADEAVYGASESTRCCLIHEASEQHDLGRALSRQERSESAKYVANEPNQIGCRDMTYLKGTSERLVLLSVHDHGLVQPNDSELGSVEFKSMRKAAMLEGCLGNPDVLHADNGSPQKSYTFRVKLEQLSISASYR